MICSVIDNPASFEILAVIRFLHAESMSAAEIHHELCALYGQYIMSKGIVGQGCRMFKDSRTNFHHEERSGRPSVVSDLIASVDQKSCERRRFTISEISSRTVLYEIIMVILGYHKFCTKRVPKILTRAHKMQRMASALTFLE
jgi:hypothetical protein